MSRTKIYHNPECSKSSCALEFITQQGMEFEIINYLENTPKKEELLDLLNMLNMSPFELIRKTELIYKEKFEGQSFTNEQWIDIMLQYPILIERPIVTHNGKAIIARPTKKVLDLFE
ncbi:arsenate reductase (glutaredoxin) [Myroides guanonis]|uniref:Arsenate reductase n=1 Tax=Myroides guanonis TaxID=1150112 RepID=A0A1I3S4Y6_9FLAO|nr:arsenate reductase (glutaredoxin) [Myroides guanonis]SFJ53440.1 arsenate reductase [Myroides guanonis]